MHFRNLRRHLLFNKALRKVQRTHSLPGSLIELLHLMYEMNGLNEYLPVKRIELVLIRINRFTHYRHICERCMILVERGYLIRNDVIGNTYWFKLSIQGLNLLNEFERVLKKERWDR